jgi:imidazolonepropionase-like amidohydrolase
MATVNAGQALKLNTGSIYEGKLADLIIVNQISKNPYLSIINRTEPSDIKNLIFEGQIIL